MRRKPAFLYVLVLMPFAMASCKKDAVREEIAPQPHAVKLEVPENFPEAIANLDNPLSEEGIELGRRLFYDVRLSGNNRISCASCHRQELAFSDGLALGDQGLSGRTLTRHAPALFNLTWADKGLFWDGGSKNLESQAFGPLTSEDEMHQDLFELEAELKRLPEYVRQFKLVFNEEIRSANVVKALAQFQRTLISGTSRYDKYIRKEAGGMLSESELLGLNLVNAKCSSCHRGTLFTDQDFHNNGLDAAFSDAEEGIYQGRFRVSFAPADLGKFKTPSLRNVLFTAPYMHDGRFKTIAEVLDHYGLHLQVSQTLDLQLYQNQGKPGIPLTAQEKGNIIDFLASLSDEAFINNKKISNPY